MALIRNKANRQVKIGSFIAKFIFKHDLTDLFLKGMEFFEYIEMLFIITNSFLYYAENTFLSELIFVCIHIIIAEELKQDLPSWPREKRLKPTLWFRDKVQKT
jgi:hypothetical protein